MLPIKGLLLRQMEEIREWVADKFNRELLYDESLLEVTRLLEEPSDGCAAALAASFLNMETWLGASGAVAVLDTRREGWIDVRRALHYKLLSVSLFRHLFEADERANRQPRGRAEHATLSLAHALATGEWSIAGSSGRYLLASLEDGGLSGAGSSPLHFFMLTLWSRSSAESLRGLEISDDDLGVYADLNRRWCDDSGFAAAIASACDYHLRRTVDQGDETAEFDRYPYNIFPVEILAAMRVRETPGEALPELCHPLLETGLSRVPTTLPSISDPLLDRCWEFVRSVGA